MAPTPIVAELNDIYNWSTVITSAILIVLYLLSLYILRSLKVGFVTWCIILLVLSNIGAILIIFANNWIHEDISWVWLQGSAGLLRDVCFNVSHWWFAFEYYRSAVAMPFIFKREQMPAQQERNL